MTDRHAGGPEDRWARIDALFTRCLDLSPSERSAFLDDRCGDDAQLRAGVEALLAAAEDSAAFMEAGLPLAAALDVEQMHEAITAGDGTSSADDGGDRVGARLGPYRILERLGRGGMATVYRAERVDGQWTQEVAIKVVRRGLDTADIVARFRAERQILSSLRHPHVARLLDGGTTDDGLPYLVMEYVAGTAITRYCDEQRMGVDDRLVLFCKVARAIHYAHRNLVVHRDVKPSNILVDDDGEPRLLDFGIAKVLGESSDAEGRTRQGRVLLTPEYASPEQLRGGPVTTSSDVYQLGVLLSVLLCGGRPHAPGTRGSSASGEAVRPGLRVTPEVARLRGTSPDGLRRRLRGDLDTIVASCVDSDPERRYASAEALVADVERHLEGFPILARPPSVFYRTARLIRRRPWISAAAALVVLQALVYGIAVTRSAQALRVQTEIAESEAEAARQVQDFLVDVFAMADPYAAPSGRPASEVTVVEALDRGAFRVREELRGQPLVQARLLTAIADVYENLGAADASVPLHRESLDLYRVHLGPQARTTHEARRLLGQSFYESGQFDSAYVLLSVAVEDAERALGPVDSTTVRILHELGRATLARGRVEEGRDRLLDALGRSEELEPPRPDLADGMHFWLSNAYMALDDPDTALDYATRSLEYSRATLGDRHVSTGVKTVSRAPILLGLGRTDEAVEAFREGIDILTATMDRRHPDVVSARNNLALALQRAGDLRGAEAVLRGLLADADEDTDPLSLATRLQNLAVNLERQNRLDEARALLGQAHDAFLDALPAGHFRTAFPLLTRSGIELRAGAFREAEATAREALTTLQAALPEGHYVTAVARCRLGRALWSRGLRDEGRQDLARAASDLERSQVVAPDRAAECFRAYLEALDPAIDPRRVAELTLRLDSLDRVMASPPR